MKHPALTSNSTLLNLKSSSDNDSNKKMKIQFIIDHKGKSRSNSLARVMYIKGFPYENILSTDVHLYRICRQQYKFTNKEILTKLKALNIDNSLLNNYCTNNFTWKVKELNIEHLPLYNELHYKESRLVSILRLTPLQYLIGKYTLVSASKMYKQRGLLFKKSDAQKLLQIDVNKTCKLWEYFKQFHWI